MKDISSEVISRVSSGLFGNAGICEIQGFLDAKRATNIRITLCIEGFLRSRWSVEMTGFGDNTPSSFSCQSLLGKLVWYRFHKVRVNGNEGMDSGAQS